MQLHENYGGAGEYPCKADIYEMSQRFFPAEVFPAGYSKVLKCKSKFLDLHFEICYNFNTLSR